MVWKAASTGTRQISRSQRSAASQLPQLMAAVLQKRIRMQGFVILDHYGERFDAFRREMAAWIAAGQVKPREDVVDGLDNAPTAFIGLLQGRNFGKLVVHVGDG